MTLNRLRKIQHVISSVIFVAIFFFFLYTTKYHITEIQLSYWSANNNLSWLWNLSLALISFSFYFNSKEYIDSHPSINNRRTINRLFLISSVCLFLTSIFNINYLIPHNIFAVGYFLITPLAIFSIAHFNAEKIPILDWKINVVFPILIVVLPIITLFCYNGMAISEIIHTSLIIAWNLIIRKKL